MLKLKQGVNSYQLCVVSAYSLAMIWLNALVTGFDSQKSEYFLSDNKIVLILFELRDCQFVTFLAHDLTHAW